MASDYATAETVSRNDLPHRNCMQKRCSDSYALSADSQRAGSSTIRKQKRAPNFLRRNFFNFNYLFHGFALSGMVAHQSAGRGLRMRKATWHVPLKMQHQRGKGMR
eukprot:2910155-Amphidinium_carterae.1